MFAVLFNGKTDDPKYVSTKRIAKTDSRRYYHCLR